ncbi:hypothetical protein OF83DRAFT_1047564, partial [Amylostereum chailletii]
KQAEFWREIDYLILDESLMLSRAFLAKISRRLSAAKGAQDSQDLPFGGVNGTQSPLYYPADQGRGDKVDDILGRQIYEQFRTVVILEQQVRVKDAQWLEFLHALRQGIVTEGQVKMLKGLVLGNGSEQVDFRRGPWKDAVLITPRHAIRTRWNGAAVEQHSQKTGVQIFEIPSKDTVQGRSLTMRERLAVACRREKKGRNRNEIRGLPTTVEIAVGMKVMVTLNVDTELDIANGARGMIEEIVFEDDEPFHGDQRRVWLVRPPAYILVKLQRTK